MHGKPLVMTVNHMLGMLTVCKYIYMYSSFNLHYFMNAGNTTITPFRDVETEA